MAILKKYGSKESSAPNETSLLRKESLRKVNFADVVTSVMNKVTVSKKSSTKEIVEAIVDESEPSTPSMRRKGRVTGTGNAAKSFMQ